jgi:multidrug efflux pump subunit AcrB
MARSAAEVGEIEIVSRTSGERVLLKDVARIRETFQENSTSHRLGRGTAIGLSVSRSGKLDSIEAQRIIIAYLDELRAELPPTLRVDLFDVFADQATQRVRMLLTNGFTGLLLVMAVLFLFLNGRVAFWVAMGIPISIMAALGGMAMLGMTLNMISMFAIIMGLGIIVDDAIVVGEHTEMLHRHGTPTGESALAGARVMFAPVMAASLTTIAAFFPILTVSAEVGRIVRELPLTIILIIIASLAECFLVLPMHLKHALRQMDSAPKPPTRFNQAFVRFRENKFTVAARASYRNRYSTALATVCGFAMALTLLLSGRVGFEFFPSPETDTIFASFALTPGSPRERSELMLEEIERAFRRAEADLTDDAGGLLVYGFSSIGSTGGRGGEASLSGDHVGVYTVELQPGDIRQVRNGPLIQAWLEEVRSIAGLERLTIFERSAGGPPGRDIDVRLAGADLGRLKAAAAALAREIKTIPGVTAVEDNLPYGKQEIVIDVTPAGRAMGFNTQSVARQVRNAFEGAIARRFSDQQEEVLVRVKLAESASSPDSIRELYLRAPDGAEVPLPEVASLQTRVGYSQIRREDGITQVSVTADVDSTVATSNEVLASVSRDILPGIREAFGVELSFKGKAEEQAEAVGDTRVALGIALATMYIILAWVFSSYTTPLVVMSVIPFGLIGAIVGHWVMGYSLNMLSLMALLGLSGVMINDSIIMVSACKRLMASGKQLGDAVLSAACERLRPVILTTLTTIGGLLPLLFERSLQAQLVQPLAVTLIFGLLFAPLLVLFFVPALLGIGDDLKRRLTARRPPLAQA